MRRRYETFLGGRLLKVTELIYVGAPGRGPQPAAEPGEAAGYIDGQYRWVVDGQDVSEDVAQAMLASCGEHAGWPYTGPPVSDRRLIWLLVLLLNGTDATAGPGVVIADDAISQVPAKPALVVTRLDGAFRLEARRR